MSLGDFNKTSDGVPRPAFRMEQLIAVAVLLLLLLGSLAVMLPFVSSLAWAFVMAFSLWPLHQRIVARRNGRTTLAALIMTSAIALVLVVPTILIVANLSDDARELAQATRRWVADGPPKSPQWLENLPLIGARAGASWNQLAQEANQALRRIQASSDELKTGDPPMPATAPADDNKLAGIISGVFTWARRWVPLVGLAIVEGLTQILLSVLLTFFIFKDGLAVAQRLSFAIERIAGTFGVNLLDVAGSTIRGVVYGILGTAVVQGVMASVGFLLAGVPGAILLGLVTFCFSPLPFGPPLVWIPATIWLFHTGHSGWGTFMIVWGVGVSCVDNIVKPWIISQGSATPFILVLFGVIGGALAFGVIGVFLGPTLLAVVYRLIEQWSRRPAPIDGQLRQRTEVIEAPAVA